MLKKRYLMIAGLAALAVTMSGCGKSSSTDVAEVTPTEAPAEVTPTAAAENIVEMDDAEEESDKVIGEKTSTSTQLTIQNMTGGEIDAFYVRATPSGDEEDDEDFGEDLINGSFTLKENEKATYYFEAGTAGSSSSYDIMVTFTDEDRSQWFYRGLPLGTMKTITLRKTSLTIDGTADDYPYATYTTSTGTKEYSTLNAVKSRLGVSDSSDSESDTDSDSDSSATPTPTPSDSNTTADPTSTPAAQPTAEPSSDDPQNTNSSTRTTAEQYIGISLDDLISAVGSADMNEYEDDGDQGTTGYHYYSDFTVSTSVDADGNEIVTGVW